MRLPIRRSQLLRRSDEDGGAQYVTIQGIQRLKDELHRLETVERPLVVQDVALFVQRGDLSENAEYQEAKSRLARMDSRIFNLKDRLRRVVPIEQGSDSSGRIRLGSTVVVETNGIEKTYFIVGPQETNPSRGRISHLSPLGSALLHHVAGESVTFETPAGPSVYVIRSVS